MLMRVHTGQSRQDKHDSAQSVWVQVMKLW